MNFGGSKNNGFWLALSVAACLVILWAAFFSGPGKVLSQNPSNTTTDPNLRRLFIAASLGKTEALGDLLTAGSHDVDVRGHRGKTLLGAALNAARAKEPPTLYGTVVLLLSRGANPNLADNDGWTAMHKAAFLDNEAVMAALIQAGGDPLINVNEKSTPYEIALLHGNSGAVGAIEGTTTYRHPEVEELKEAGTFARNLRAGFSSARTVEERKAALRAALTSYLEDEGEVERVYQEVLGRSTSDFLGDCDSCEGE